MFPLSPFFSLCSPLFLPPHLSTFSSIVLFNFLLCCPFACSQGLSTPHLTKPSSVFLLMELRQWWNQPPRKMQKGGGGESSLSSNKKQIIPCLDLKKKLSERDIKIHSFCVCVCVWIRVCVCACEAAHCTLCWVGRLGFRMENSNYEYSMCDCASERGREGRI